MGIAPIVEEVLVAFQPLEIFFRFRLLSRREDGDLGRTHVEHRPGPLLAPLRPFLAFIITSLRQIPDFVSRDGDRLIQRKAQRERLVEVF